MRDTALRVGVVEKNQNPYWDSVNAGWFSAGARLGLDIDLRAPLHEDASAQRDLMVRFVEEGVDGLAFVGTVDGVFDEVCRDARERGIAVVTFDLDAAQRFRSMFVGMEDPTSIGYKAGARIAAEVGPGAVVLVQAGSGRARGAVGKLRGLTRALDDSGVRYVVSEPDGEHLELAREYAAALFAQNPGADAAIGVYGYHPEVLAHAAEESGSGARIHGFDMLPETVALIQEGRVASSVWIREYYFGFHAAAALNSLLRLGDDAVEHLGGVPDGAGRSLELEPKTFTAENLHEFLSWHETHLAPALPSPH